MQAVEVNTKEPKIVMMRVGDKKYKGDYVIEYTSTEIADGESVGDAESFQEVSMRISDPALLRLWDSIEEKCNREELETSCYKLKPCPFCGSTDVKLQSVGKYGPHYDFYGIVCNRCKMKGPQSSLQETAVYLWNKRN